jgi:hypothetical protein
VKTFLKVVKINFYDHDDYFRFLKDGFFRNVNIVKSFNTHQNCAKSQRALNFPKKV